MRQRKKRWLIFLSLILMISFSGFIFYNAFYVDLFGYSVRNSDVRDVVIYTNQHVYYVSKKKIVESIVKETSHLKRMSKVKDPPLASTQLYAKVPHFLIQTKTNASYGGNIWKDGTFMNANGYYWRVSPTLLDLLLASIKHPETTMVY